MRIPLLWFRNMKIRILYIGNFFLFKLILRFSDFLLFHFPSKSKPNVMIRAYLYHNNLQESQYQVSVWCVINFFSDVRLVNSVDMKTDNACSFTFHTLLIPLYLAYTRVNKNTETICLLYIFIKVITNMIIYATILYEVSFHSIKKVFFVSRFLKQQVLLPRHTITLKT